MNKWEKIHKERDWGRYPSEELVRFIGKNFFKYDKETRKNIKILELGTGQGANVWFLLREGFNVYGIDISQSAIRKMQDRLIKDGFKLDDFNNRFKVGDIRNIPFKDSYFDIVIDVATTWYVSCSDHKKVYNDIWRVLKKNGYFFTLHILKDSWGYDKNNLIDKDTVADVEEGPLANQGIQYFAEYDDLIELLQNSRFEICSKEILIRSYENMEKYLKFAIIVCKKS